MVGRRSWTTTDMKAEGNVELEGWLKKRGHHFFSSVKSRYFVLFQDGTLLYFTDEKRKKQKGGVRVTLQDVVTCLPNKDKIFPFELKKVSNDHDAKPYVLTMLAVTEAERTCWVDTLRKVMTGTVPPLRMSTMLRNASTRVLNEPVQSDVFGMLLEIGKLQELVQKAKSEWGTDPLKWTSDQYLELCQSIVFTHEQAAGLSLSLAENQVLQEALELRYKYEDAHAQATLLHFNSADKIELETPPVQESEEPHQVQAIEKIDPTPAATSGIRKYFETLDPAFVAFSPRSKTMAKYASLYQQESISAKRCWNMSRDATDDLLQTLYAPITVQDLTDAITHRFESDRVYTYVGDTLLSVNPAPRLLHHSMGTSIYDEATAFWYRDHELDACSPHPFALAKRTLANLQDSKDDECIVFLGESGSGKTDFAKQVIKYIATIQQAPKPPKIQLYTSSTKSTIKMRSDEAHIMDLLDSKHVKYDTIYLDIDPTQWADMLKVSLGVKQLPQVHIDSMYFGTYDELQRLEDDEQFVFYVKNPKAARLTSVLLDGNILLEAFGNASTVHNPNSSRFGKSTTFHLQPITGQLLGGVMTPFFLETSRVTNVSPDTYNFHIFYALLMGGSASLHKELHLSEKSSLSFSYLGNNRQSHFPTGEVVGSYDEDRQRWHQVLRCFDLIGISEVDRSSIFKVLAAILYIGNMTFGDVLNAQGVAEGVKISSSDDLSIICGLLSMDAATIEHAICTKRLNVAKAAETFELHVHSPQAMVARDSFARLLYRGLFHSLVEILNRSTSSKANADMEVRQLTLIDVFGFEYMSINSFEQLCINYLTEKLTVFRVEYASNFQNTIYIAEGLEDFWPTHENCVPLHEGPGLQVLESPVGVWACLEEATLLHTNEVDSKQSKNSRFVRALYLRNVGHAGLKVEQNPLQFTIVHHRSAVTYSATNFVGKNSDALSTAIHDLLSSSSNSLIQGFVNHVDGILAQNVAPSNKRQTPSVATQFKAHIQSILTKLEHSNPHFVHCLRPRVLSSKDYYNLDKSLLEAQVHGYMLAESATWASLLFRYRTSIESFRQRYRMLFAGNTLDTELKHFVQQHLPHEWHVNSYAIGTTLVFYTQYLHEALQRRRDILRTEAVLVIQSTVRMWRAKVCVREMRKASQQYVEVITAFYAAFNPSKLPQVPSIIRAFRGREAVLLAKLEQKYAKKLADKPAEAPSEVHHEPEDKSLEAFILSVQFDAKTVQQMLLDPKMALFLAEPQILQALREVSIDPSVIYLQTNEPVLRLFYTELRKYLEPKPNQNRIVYQRLPLQEAITLLSQNHLLVPTPTMTPSQSSVIQELAADPQLLPFHIDEAGVADFLEAFIREIDGDISDVPVIEVLTPPVQTLATSATVSPTADENVPTALIPTEAVVEKQVPMRYQDMDLEQAVEKLVQAHLLRPTPSMTPEEAAIVEEIAMDPTMLAFHLDDPAVCHVLMSICKCVDAGVAAALEPTFSPARPEDDQVHISTSPNTGRSTGSPDEQSSSTVEFKRIKFTPKLMKRVMADDALMTMLAEPSVTEFLEQFSEDTSNEPTIAFTMPQDARVVAFYERLLELVGFDMQVQVRLAVPGRCHFPFLEMLRSALSRAVRRSFATSVESLAVRSMVGAFRKHGHLEASLDPLFLEKPKPLPELDAATFAPVLGLHSVDASGEVFFANAANANPHQLYQQLRSTYCGPIGIEMEHLRSTEEREWLAKEMESPSLKVTPSMQRNAFTAMMTAEVFENFLAKKFSSFKRYSGEGAESMLAAIQTILSTAGAQDVSDVVIGMPHRGRLALLVGLLEYPVHKLLYKIQGHSEFPEHIHGVDDVTSHIAQSMDYGIGKKVHVSLLHNPSHLEIINPVATGKVRAKNDAGAKAMALLLHGDAAFSGQGCVPEGLSLSQLPSFKTDGTVHIVVNNQVGFTTTKRDGRSSTYCTDVAKGFEIPVIHVNGESIPHVLQAAHMATEFRNKFKKDIIIDLWTFRRHGHNEVDEPRFTQPGMYGAITAKGSFPTVYGQQLVEQKLLTPEAIEKLKTKLTAHLEAELAKTADYKPTDVDAFKGKWSEIHQPTPAEQRATIDTGVDTETLKAIGFASVDVPKSIKVHDRLERTHIQARKKLLSQEKIKVDWSTAEAMAFGSLLKDGHSVRLAGQDCRRATFSHRHAAFTDQSSEDMYFPFQNLPAELNPQSSRFQVINSNLSELAVLGYEYGYSWEDPKNLCIWEAQFGDFFNGAQIVIDQFIASGESKWMRQSGLVMLLPHGYDGAGPDHSSGKPERFLQLVDTQALESTLKDSLAAYESDINMSVVNLTTPANYFHMLRRQQLRQFRKPVVVMAPKTLLRLAEATSDLSELGPGTSFQPVIGDDLPADGIKRVMFVSGKLYYDLVKQRASHERNDTAIIRVEELAPFPFAQVQEQLNKYGNVKDVVWIQEEPANQGAWLYIRPHFEKCGVENLKFIGREALPTSAVGLSKRNAKEAQEIMRQAWTA